MNIYCHGDVVLFQEKIPKTASVSIETNILMKGEHTGHAHRLNIEDFKENKPKQKKFEVIKDPNSNIIYLRVLFPSDLTHEEHKKITLPPGEYRIGQVREKGMFDDMINPVVD